MILAQLRAEVPVAKPELATPLLETIKRAKAIAPLRLEVRYWEGRLLELVGAPRAAAVLRAFADRAEEDPRLHALVADARRRTE